MLSSRCEHCGSPLFELQTKTESESVIPICFVHCASCKSPIGVLNCESNIRETEHLINHMNYIESLLKVIDSKITHEENTVKKLFQSYNF